MSNTDIAFSTDNRRALSKFLLGLAVLWGSCAYYLAWTGKGLEIATSFPLIFVILGVNFIYVGASICGYGLSASWGKTDLGKIVLVGGGLPLILFGVAEIIFYVAPSSDLAFWGAMLLSAAAFVAMQVVWLVPLRAGRWSAGRNQPKDTV